MKDVSSRDVHMWVYKLRDGRYTVRVTEGGSHLYGGACVSSFQAWKVGVDIVEGIHAGFTHPPRTT